MNVLTNKLKFSTVLFILVISHAAINTYIPNLMLNYVMILFVSYILTRYTNYLRDGFTIVLLFYILSHFEFANSQCGLYNIAFFIVILFAKAAKVAIIKNRVMLLAIIVTIVFAFLGMIIKSKAPLMSNIIGFITLLSYMTMIMFIAEVKFTLLNIGTFIKTSLIMLVYILLSQLNSKYAWITISSPLVNYSEAHYQHGATFGSVLGTSPITAEYAMIHFMIGLLFLLSMRSLVQFGINRQLLISYTILALVVMLFTDNRSTLVLTVAYVFFMLSRISSSLIGLQKAIVILVLLIFVLFAVNPIFKFNNILSRFEEENFRTVSVTSIKSGEALNRETAFQLGNEMLKRENWIVGYGWNSFAHNKTAWFGDVNQVRGDPHSLYFALPMLFGWIGSFSFLVLILYPVLIRVRRKALGAGRSNDVRIISNGLSFILLLFIANQYKQAFIVSPSYFMIIIIVIGMTYSIKTNGLHLA